MNRNMRLGQFHVEDHDMGEPQGNRNIPNPRQQDDDNDEAYESDFSDCSVRAEGLDLENANGFDRGLKVDRILDVVEDSNDRLVFLILFKGMNQAEMVPLAVAKARVPKIVNAFYRDRLTWPLRNFN